MKTSKLLIIIVVILGSAFVAWQILQIEPTNLNSHDHDHATSTSHESHESHEHDDGLDDSEAHEHFDTHENHEYEHEHDTRVHDEHDTEENHGHDHESLEHEEKHTEQTEINVDSAKSAGIVVAVAGSREIQPRRLFPGEIAFNRNRVAHVVPRLSGVVVSVLKNEGDLVKKGERLAAIDSRELASLKGSYMASKKRLELAKITYQREEKLWKERKSAELEFLTAKQALKEVEIDLEVSAQQLRAIGFTEKLLANIASEKTPPTRLTIHAPQNGTVVSKHISLGESISDNDNIYTIADLSNLWGNITIYADDINNIHQGQKVIVSSEALNIESEGDIEFISSQIDEKSQSVAARVNIPNLQGVWRPGLFVNVEVIFENSKANVAVPKAAIQTLDDKHVVFIVEHKTYKAIPVELGLSDRHWIEVLSGLSVGQLYVAENSYLIKADIGKASASHDH